MRSVSKVLLVAAAIVTPLLVMFGSVSKLRDDETQRARVGDAVFTSIA